tara:strand:+ start:96 stop:824 length:729 start_codon:yes stop_codon:yes gene_type:complete
MTNVYNSKIIVLGDTGVGKTALLNRLIHNQYQYSPIATIGVDMLTYTIIVDKSDKSDKINQNNKNNQNNKKNKNKKKDKYSYQIYFWDTSGDRRFIHLTSSYFENSVIAIVIFDLINESSFSDIDYWIDQYYKYYPSGTIILVGNKSDLLEKKVSQEMIDKKIEQLKCSYIEVSANTGYNINELEQSIVNELGKLVESGVIKLSSEYQYTSFPNSFTNIIRLSNNDNQDNDSFWDCSKCTIS